jgi:hypothetical protein
MVSKICLNVCFSRNDTTRGVSKLELHINDIWYGKEATPYEGVAARIDAITTRNVQVSFDRVITVDDMLTGAVMIHKQFRLHFYFRLCRKC